MARLSEMNDDEAGAALLKAYRGACDAHDPDGDEPHPSRAVGAWMDTVRAAKARDENSGLGPKTIMKRGTPEEENALDDEQPRKSAGGNSGNGGATPAMDGQFSTDEKSRPIFTFADGRVVTGDAALVAQARAIDPAKVRAMKRAIPSYGRLGK